MLLAVYAGMVEWGLCAVGLYFGGGHDAVNAHSYSRDSRDPRKASPTADMRVSRWGGQMTNPLPLPSLRGRGGLPTHLS